MASKDVPACVICGQTANVRRIRVDIADIPGHHADLCGTCREPLHNLIVKIDACRQLGVRVGMLPIMSEADMVKLARRMTPKTSPRNPAPPSSADSQSASSAAERHERVTQAPPDRVGQYGDRHY